MSKLERNRVLYKQAKEFHWQGSGVLSLKWFENGEAFYQTKNTHYRVGSNRILVLNEGDYSITIDSDKEVESFCLFFRQDLKNEIFHSLLSSHESLLDNPYLVEKHNHFIQSMTYSLDEKLSTQLSFFKEKFNEIKEDEWLFEQQFYLIMEKILFEQYKIKQEIDKLDAVKHSTKEELFKRVVNAHEYIHAYYDTPLSIDEVSKVACLSVNHLLRCYEKKYHITPYQQITYFRVKKAKELLQETNKSMTEIALDIGLQTSSSFSKLFKKHVGISPRSFRKK